MSLRQRMRFFWVMWSSRWNAPEIQAGDYGHSLSREVCYLTVHGVLHLLGYDHEEAEDAACMRELEESVMKRIGLPR